MLQEHRSSLQQRRHVYDHEAHILDSEAVPHPQGIALRVHCSDDILRRKYPAQSIPLGDFRSAREHRKRLQPCASRTERLEPFSDLLFDHALKDGRSDPGLVNVVLVIEWREIEAVSVELEPDRVQVICVRMR